jgi:tetratricopeptide (TPR) repeat protein
MSPTLHEPKSYQAIMVSSTFTDLEEHRQKVIKAIDTLGYRANVMENDGARGDVDVIESSLRMVRDSAAYLGVISLKYGQTPFDPDRNPDRLSITELEFNEAMRLNRPIVLFIMGEKHPVLKADVEINPDRIKKLDAFREHAKRMRGGSETNRVYAVFESLEQFSAAAAVAIGRLVQHLESSGRKTAEGAAPSGKVPLPVQAMSNVPINVPLHFLGRDEDLAAIDAALKRREGRAAITALHGLRGVGKTTLAAAYAERHRRDYRATWWIRAETESTMRADLVGLGVRLGWAAADAKEEPALAEVLERLRHEGDGILLIYDNANNSGEIRQYLPRDGAAKVIVTSNAPNWRGVAAPVEIEVWTKEIGADYLIAGTGRNQEREAALALSEALEGLPLAHAQAAAYCDRLGISLADYQKRFEAAPDTLLDDQRDAATDYHDGRTVAKTFALAIDEAAKRHPAAEPLIVYAALLAPGPIPLFLLSEARTEFGEPIASALAEDGLDEAVAALRAFALVDRETIVNARDSSVTTEVIRLHRLVREIAAKRWEKEQRATAERALIGALEIVFPEDSFYNHASWPRCELLMPHLLAVCEPELADPKASTLQAVLLARADAYFHARASYVAARSASERALAIRERILGPDHPDTATSLNDLGFVLKEQGDFEGAKRYYQRALAIDEKALGAEHPHTATDINNLARLLHDQGDLTGARSLFERALAIREKAHGEDHPDTARSLNNLGGLLQAQGDLRGLDHSLSALWLSERGC